MGNCFNAMYGVGPFEMIRSQVGEADGGRKNTPSAIKAHALQSLCGMRLRECDDERRRKSLQVENSYKLYLWIVQVNKGKTLVDMPLSFVGPSITSLSVPSLRATMTL